MSAAAVRSLPALSWKLIHMRPKDARIALAPLRAWGEMGRSTNRARISVVAIGWRSSAACCVLA